MLSRFFPQIYEDSIYTIPYDELIESGINGLIFDIDNTLVPHDVELPTSSVIELFDSLLEMGFKICLLSNNNHTRVTAFNIKLKLPNVAKAKKPALKGINRAMNLIDTGAASTAIIGDQVFTDVWCGNRLGIKTILVKPISKSDEFFVKWKRGIESIIVKIYLKKRGVDSDI